MASLCQSLGCRAFGATRWTPPTTPVRTTVRARRRKQTRCLRTMAVSSPIHREASTTLWTHSRSRLWKRAVVPWRPCWLGYGCWTFRARNRHRGRPGFSGEEDARRLWPNQGGQGRLTLSLGIERDQPFCLGGTQQALVSGDQDQLVPAAAKLLTRAVCSGV